MLNLLQGKIFYDIEHFNPKQGGELRGQSADVNGNGQGHVTKEASMVNDEEMLSYPPNIVVEEFNSDNGQVTPRIEFEMGPTGSSSSNNSETASVEDGSAGETIATSRL